MSSFKVGDKVLTRDGDPWRELFRGVKAVITQVKDTGYVFAETERGEQLVGSPWEFELIEDCESAPPPDKAKGLATDEELTQLQSKLTVDRLLSDFDTPETPNHYSGDLVMRVIEERGLDFALGNVVKYVSRAGTKPGESKLRDLKKAQWYLTRVIDWEENN